MITIQAKLTQSLRQITVFNYTVKSKL